MGDIIDMNGNKIDQPIEENPSITKEELDEFLAQWGEVTGSDNGDQLEEMIKLLALPDEQFIILAPGVMQNYNQSLNNPEDRLMLTQALNANGMKAEDLLGSLDDLFKEIDQVDLSNPKKDFLKQIFAALSLTINETEGISKRIVPTPIELCHPDAKVPQYAHISDSGMDVFAIEDITIKPGETALVPTGIKVALTPGYELQVRPKSGRALKTKLRVANTPGTIDQSYRDEIKIIIENVEPPIKDITYDFDENGKIIITSILHGSNFEINKGEKFCQLVLSEVPKVSFYQVDSVMNIGEDRGGGFGSTTIYDKNDPRYKAAKENE